MGAKQKAKPKHEFADEGPDAEREWNGPVIKLGQALDLPCDLVRELDEENL